MKKILAAVSLCLFTMSAYAAKEPMQGRYTWTIGMDGKAVWAAPNGTYWDMVFYEFKSAGTIYIANRFTNIWSIEFGYSWTDRKPRSFNLAPGEEAFGATAANQMEYSGKIRFKETYIDFYAHLPITKWVEIMGGPGIGFARTGFEFNFAPNNTTDPVAMNLMAIEGRTEITARVNIGMQALWTERVGIRLLFGYETLNNVTARNVDADYVDPHLVNNAYSVSLGLYWNFMGHD